MLRKLRLASFGVTIVVAVLLAVVWTSHLAPGSRLATMVDGMLGTPVVHLDPASVALPNIAIGGPFTLVDSAGRVVRQDSFPGRWLLIYFGYTSCPDICPTTLQAIAGALQGLGGAADRVAPLFITLDPARDTPAVLARYTALFDPHIIGLTGSAAQLAAAEQAYRVYAAKVVEPGANSYAMDHSSFTYLMSPAGELVAMFDRTVTTATLLATLRGHLR